MQQNGDFRDEAEGEECITQFFNEDVDVMTEAAAKYANNRRWTEEEVCMKWEQQFVRWIVKRSIYIEYEAFIEWEA